MHDREGARVSARPAEEEARNGSFFGIGTIHLSLPTIVSSIFGRTFQLYGIFMSRLKLFLCMPATDSGGDFCLIFGKQASPFYKIEHWMLTLSQWDYHPLATSKIKMCYKTLYSKREVEAEAWMGCPSGKCRRQINKLWRGHRAMKDLKAVNNKMTWGWQCLSLLSVCPGPQGESWATPVLSTWVSEYLEDLSSSSVPTRQKLLLMHLRWDCILA